LHQFNEHHAELKGFSEYFDRELYPILQARDGERIAKRKAAKLYGAGIIGLGIVCMALAIIFKWDDDLYGLIAVGTIGAVILMYGWLIKGVSDFTKQQIVGGICQYVGWTFLSKPPVGPDLTTWNRLFLIPAGYEAVRSLSNKTVKFEDQISGKAHGADFNSIEVKLTRQSGKKTITDFHGQLMIMTFPRKFLGRTLVLRDKGWFQRKKKSDMKRVGLVDPVFEKIFEAYSTDQVEARYLLDPVFMQKLIDLEQSILGKNIRFAFHASQLFIAVETGNRYEAGSMRHSLMDPNRTQRILNEIGAIYDVVDGVMERKR